MPNLFSNVDYIPPNVQVLSGQATLYISKDIEDVIKQ